MIVEDWGLIEYTEGSAAAERPCSKVSWKARRIILILCEHPPVLTLGRMTDPDSLLYQREEIEERGVMITNR